MDLLDLIANMDETPICYENIYSTTINTIGAHSIPIKNFNKDKLRIFGLIIVF